MLLLQALQLNIKAVTLGSFLLGLSVSAGSTAIDDNCPIIVASKERNSHRVSFHHELFKALDGDLK